MQNSFQHIASFQFSHEFYREKQSVLFQLSVPQESQKALLNYNLVIKTFESGFHLLSVEPALLEDDWKSIRFYFFLSNPLFLNFTELEGFELQKSLIFLSNLSSAPLGQSGVVHLHEEEFIDEKSIATINFDKKLPYKSPHGDTFKVTDELGTFVDFGQEGELLNSIDEGNYLLSSNDSIQNHYIFQQKSFKVPELVFSLYPAKLFEQYKDKKPVSYQVKFKARSTKWRYILADPAINKIPNLGIKDFKKDKFAFIEKELFVTGLGQTRVFESEEAYKLQHVYPGDFQLIEHPDLEPIKRNIIIKSLPRASPDSIYQETEFPKEFYSHIFI